MKASWRDWLASRTVKINATLAVAFAALIAWVATLSDADLLTLGLTEKQAIIAMAAIKVASAVANLWLRADTTGPLAGRAGGPDPMADVQDAR